MRWNPPTWVTRRRVLRLLGALVLLAVLVLAFNLVRAVTALSAMGDDGTAIANHVAKGDLAGAEASANTLKKHAAAARDASSGVVWTVATWVPFLGKNFDAVRTSAEVANAIAEHSMPTLLGLASELQTGDLKPVDGRVDPAVIAGRAPAVKAAALGVDGPAAKMAKIRSQDLIPPVNEFVQLFQDRVRQARIAADAAANAFEVLPTMVGGQGPRDYLLLVQNPAEIRGSGGLPGTWAVIHADNGKLTMTSTGDAAKQGGVKLPYPPSAEEQGLFGSDFGRDPRDITLSPDFPRVAQLAAAKLKQTTGVDALAVFSVDPESLSYVLHGTGPVTLKSGFVLTAENAGAVLLNGVYQNFADRLQQQDFIGSAAHSSFDALVHGQGNEAIAIKGLVRGVAEHRVFAWSAEPNIARVIGAERLTGALPADDGATPNVGIYMNDDVQGKPEFFLQHSSVVKATGCSDGVQTLELTTTFRSNMPANAASLSIWVVGTGVFQPKGEIVLDTLLLGPWRGGIDSLEIDGKPASLTSNQLNGRQVGVVLIRLVPGQLVTLKAIMHTGPGQTADGNLTWTPGMEGVSNPSRFVSAC